jgi:Mn-dependent DtxR family transcriptional regulator
MVYGYYENQFYTISHLVKEMNTNRQTVSTMLNECENEDYIIVQREGKTVACHGSKQLVEAMDEYSEWRKKLIEDTIYQPYINLKQFENWMKRQFNT